MSNATQTRVTPDHNAADRVLPFAVWVLLPVAAWAVFVALVVLLLAR